MRDQARQRIGDGFPYVDHGVPVLEDRADEFVYKECVRAAVSRLDVAQGFPRSQQNVIAAIFSRENIFRQFPCRDFRFSMDTVADDERMFSRSPRSARAST